jgi:hypothetical protein
VVKGPTYKRSEAIQLLFGVKLTGFAKFKDKIITLENKECINFEHEMAMGGANSRGKRSYLPSQLNRLHNVVLISAFYSEPAIVKALVDKLNHRQDRALALRELLAGRDRVGDIQFNTNALTSFLDRLEVCCSLDDERLPNPFIQLPQVIDNGTGKSPCVLDAYNSTDLALTQSERMLAAYLDLDIELAYQLSTTLDSESNTIHKLKQWIEREYREAQRFDDLLGSFFN